jgi:glucose/arabinose dehydrogenase
MEGEMVVAQRRRSGRRVDRSGVSRRTLAVAVIVGLAGAAESEAQIGQPAPGQQDDGDVGAPIMPTPTLPSEPYDFVAVEAPNSTVRPEHREFSAALLENIRLPAGFTIAVFAQDLAEPRGLAVAPNGDVYVAEREDGRVRLLRDTNGDGRADVSRFVSEGLRENLRGVHDVAVHQGRLYMVTETELYAAAIQTDGALAEPELLMDDIPAGGQHPNRTIDFSPDGTLFLSIGSTCNACVEPMEDHAAMHRVSDDGREREIYAEGLRNTIGFGWHPVTGEFWGLDHNSDGRGENWPPEELNRIVEGSHYGWPFCGGDRQPDHHLPADPEDPEPMTKEEFCAGTESPVLTYQGHAAPMQMVFYTAEHFPAEYRNDAFATMRGSWNRNPPTGYEVVRIRFDEAGQPVTFEPFATGWLIDDGRAHFGRLMGIGQAADGSLLIGDDTNGVIYRIAYER